MIALVFLVLAHCDYGSGYHQYILHWAAVLAIAAFSGGLASSTIPDPADHGVTISMELPSGQPEAVSSRD